MKIRIYSITKRKIRCDDFINESKQFGVTIEDIPIFNSNIQKAQKESEYSAKVAYGIEFSKYIKRTSLNIALHPNGDEINTIEFSNLIKDRGSINFFIGGAFGFEDSFIKRANKAVSLSKLTFSHNVAKVVLFEQIFRALCIINNHPYHKE